MVSADGAPKHLWPPEGGAQGGRGRPSDEAWSPGGGEDGVALNILGWRVGGQVGRRGVGMEARGPRGWSHLREHTFKSFRYGPQRFSQESRVVYFNISYLNF